MKKKFYGRTLAEAYKAAESDFKFDPYVIETYKENSDYVLVASDQPELKEEKINSVTSDLEALVTEQLGYIVWDKYKYKNPKQSVLLEQLTAAGLSPKFIIENIINQGISEMADAVNLLSSMLKVNKHSFQRFNVFIGNSGAGKTSTMLKYIYKYAFEHCFKDVLVINLDQHIGSDSELYEHMKFMDFTLVRAKDLDEVNAHIARYTNKKIIFIDLGADHIFDKNLLQALISMKKKYFDWSIINCLSSASMLDPNRRHNELINELSDGYVITKIDENIAGLAPIIENLIINQQTLLSVTTGASFISDLNYIPANKLIGMLVANNINNSVDHSIAKYMKTGDKLC